MIVHDLAPTVDEFYNLEAERYNYPPSFEVQQERARERQMGRLAAYEEISEPYRDLGGLRAPDDPIGSALLELKADYGVHRMAFENFNIKELLSPGAFSSMTNADKKETALQFRSYMDRLDRYSQLSRIDGSEETVRVAYDFKGTDEEVFQSGVCATNLINAIKGTAAYREIIQHTFETYKSKASWNRAARNKKPYDDFFVVIDTKVGKLRTHIES